MEERVSAEEKRIHREIFEEAAKRLIPASAYLISPVAGFAASLWVFTTWLLLRGRARTRGRGEAIIEDLVEVSERIREIEEMIARRRRALDAASPPARRELLEDIRLLEKERLLLEQRRRILLLRMRAWRLAEATGDKELLESLRRLEEKLRNSPREARDEAARVLTGLEEMLERGEIREEVLESLLDELLESSVFAKQKKGLEG